MSLRGARLLLVLPQLPQDPASGAARSTRTMCEMLAAAGAEVHAVATTASERGQKTDSVTYLRELGIHPTIHRGHTADRVRPELEFDDRGVYYKLLDVGHRDMMTWQKVLGNPFDRLFDRELYSFRPDLLVAFGGLSGDARRYERARNQGARIVFSLRNEAYLPARDLLAAMDGIITPSRYLTDFYRTPLASKARRSRYPSSWQTSSRPSATPSSSP